jgi:Domain of unknown function (DUF397)
VSRYVTPSDIPPSARASLAWRVARDCDAGTCISVAPHKGMIVIGDTKNPDGPVLSYNHDEWLAFVRGIRQGDFDDLL